MSFDCYLNQSKPMLEWKLHAKLHKNPRLIRVFNIRNRSHPLIREDRDIDLDEFSLKELMMENIFH